ncbi:MAG: hypothetical protein EP329_09975 [Deltaproteobacteria bacterium]|nr:MAG: hypothetical protein EP329_09975 [Deltaproteobacteria bacterium]
MTADIVERARLLGQELADAAGDLERTGSARAAVVLLDRRRRCARYPAEILEAAGLTEAVLLASELSPASLAEMGRLAAESLDLSGLVNRFARVADGALDTPTDCGLDLLLVAELADDLPLRARTECYTTVSDSLSWVDSHPHRFLTLPELASDRCDLELADQGGELVVRVLDAFSNVAASAIEVREIEDLAARDGVSNGAQAMFDALVSRPRTRPALAKWADFLRDRCADLAGWLGSLADAPEPALADDGAEGPLLPPAVLYSGAEFEVLLAYDAGRLRIELHGERVALPYRVRLDDAQLARLPLTEDVPGLRAAWELPATPPAGWTHLWLESDDGVTDIAMP